MIRRMLTVGTLALVCAAASTPAAAAGHRSGTYRGTLSSGGHIALTVRGSVITKIRFSGQWQCDNGVTPISYTYNVRNRTAQRPHIHAGGRFKARHLKFSSPDTVNNTGSVQDVSTWLSGTFKESKLSGHFSVSGSASNAYPCGDGGTYTATLSR